MKPDQIIAGSISEPSFLSLAGVTTPHESLAAGPTCGSHHYPYGDHYRKKKKMP